MKTKVEMTDILKKTGSSLDVETCPLRVWYSQSLLRAEIHIGSCIALAMQGLKTPDSYLWIRVDQLVRGPGYSLLFLKVPQ